MTEKEIIKELRKLDKQINELSQKRDEYTLKLSEAKPFKMGQLVWAYDGKNTKHLRVYNYDIPSDVSGKPNYYFMYNDIYSYRKIKEVDPSSIEVIDGVLMLKEE